MRTSDKVYGARFAERHLPRTSPGAGVVRVGMSLSTRNGCGVRNSCGSSMHKGAFSWTAGTSRIGGAAALPFITLPITALSLTGRRQKGSAVDSDKLCSAPVWWGLVRAPGNVTLTVQERSPRTGARNAPSSTCRGREVG